MAEDKEKQEKLQQKYMELQMVGQQMQQMQKQLELVSNQTVELQKTKKALDDISKTEPGTETVFPLASGIFLKGKITDNKEVVMNVGADTAVNKTIPESQKIIDQQLKEMTDFKKQLDGNLANIASKSQELEKELSELAK